jgi:basic amino acid/polyamine antiporter, APA family
VWAIVIAMTGKYDQILNYVVAIDVLFFGLTGASLIIFRRRDPAGPPNGSRVPGHPFTTGLFVLACWTISASTVAQHPSNAGIGVAILFIGVVVYQFWARSAVRAA